MNVQRMKWDHSVRYDSLSLCRQPTLSARVAVVLAPQACSVNAPCQ